MEKKTKLEAAEKRANEAAEKLKAFEGIDPTKVKELISAQEKAEAERKKAEEEALAKRGEWDRLKSQMVDAHTKEIEKERTELASERAARQAAEKQIADLTVGQSFQSSPFIKDELALTPVKARVIFGSHFEFKDGAIVAFDKPVGAKDRTLLVDGKGNALGFEDAIKKIVDADPEKDHLVKSKLRPGAGSSTLPGKGKEDDDSQELRGTAKIAAGLKALSSKKK
jgi:hypothetical protein